MDAERVGVDLDGGTIDSDDRPIGRHLHGAGHDLFDRDDDRSGLATRHQGAVSLIGAVGKCLDGDAQSDGPSGGGEG